MEGCEDRVVLGCQAILGSGHEVQLETVDSRGVELTSFSAAVGAADESSDGLTSLGAAMGMTNEANDKVGFRKYDRSLSGILDLVFVLGSASTLFKGGASGT